MAGWFIRVLNMSLTGGIVVLAVLLARLFLQKALKVFSYCLWFVVLLRLLCPVSFPTPVSLLGVLGAPAASQGRMVYLPEDDGTWTELVAAGQDAAGRVEVAPSPSGQTEIADASPGQNVAAQKGGVLFDLSEWVARIRLVLKGAARFLPLAAAVWLLGAFLLAAHGALGAFRLRKRLAGAKEAEPVGTVRVRYSDAAPACFVLGLFRPVIYLPSGLGERERSYILLHEMVHIRRGDQIFRLAFFVALCLHWFNPFAWVAFAFSEKDMEMSCDEAVIRKAGSGIKKEYSASLLSMSTGMRYAYGTPLSFGEGDTGNRIWNVLRYRKPAFLSICLAAAACLACAVFFLGNPAPLVEMLASTEGGQVYYGILTRATSPSDLEYTVVMIPEIGAVCLPEAEEVSPYIETDFTLGLELGDLVRITFPEGEEVTLSDYWPKSFSAKAKSIEVMGRGFGIVDLGNSSYHLTVPMGSLKEAQAGDSLQLTYEGSSWKKSTAVRVLSVDRDQYDIWVEMSSKEAAFYLEQWCESLGMDIGKYLIKIKTSEVP